MADDSAWQLTTESGGLYNCPMSTPLLAAKLSIPPGRQRVVLRHRLMERMNAGRHRKLTLIAAPAGYGKTTLVSG